jgi:hypothetical protein
MTRSNQRGFAGLTIILGIVGLLIIGGAGWYVWKNQKKVDKAPASAATNTDQTSSTTPTETVDETDKWFEYTSAQKTYSLRLPDGWELWRVNSAENIYGRGPENITYKKGTAAKVTDVEGGWDGPSSFSLYVPGIYADQIVRQGTKIGEFTTSQGKVAEKYYHLQTTEPEFIGYQKDSKVYNYYFSADGKNLQVEYVTMPTATDQTALIEQALKTLEIN